MSERRGSPDIIHHSFGSQQMRLLRRGIRAGLSVEEAAKRADYDIDTARLIAADDLKNPPPEAAYALLYDPDAPADASSTKEPVMAKEEEAGEYKRPDAAKAFEIYDKQIKPKEAHLATIKGDMSEPYQAIKDQANYPRKVLNFIIGIEGEEDAKRDHLMLALAEGLKHRKLFLPRDLVTMAAGEDGGEVVPTSERDNAGIEDFEKDLNSAGAVNQSPDDADPGQAVSGFTEASPEELEKQAGRKPRASRTARPASVSRINPPASEARAH